MCRTAGVEPGRSAERRVHVGGRQGDGGRGPGGPLHPGRRGEQDGLGRGAGVVGAGVIGQRGGAGPGGQTPSRTVLGGHPVGDLQDPVIQRHVGGELERRCSLVGDVRTACESPQCCLAPLERRPSPFDRGLVGAAVRRRSRAGLRRSTASRCPGPASRRSGGRRARDAGAPWSTMPNTSVSHVGGMTPGLSVVIWSTRARPDGADQAHAGRHGPGRRRRTRRTPRVGDGGARRGRPRALGEDCGTGRTARPAAVRSRCPVIVMRATSARTSSSDWRPGPRRASRPGRRQRVGPRRRIRRRRRRRPGRRGLRRRAPRWRTRRGTHRCRAAARSAMPVSSDGAAAVRATSPGAPVGTSASSETSTSPSTRAVSYTSTPRLDAEQGQRGVQPVGFGPERRWPGRSAGGPC